jgi:aldose 1-epimerase
LTGKSAFGRIAGASLGRRKGGTTETVTLSSRDSAIEAAFAPEAGMVCCSLRHEESELLAQRDGLQAYAERGATMGVPLLYPWANRLAGFGYRACGRRVELASDSPLLALDGNGLPIHGVIPGHLPWSAARSDDGGTRLTAQLSWDRPELLEVFPFPHRLDYEARLGGASLTITTTVHATGGVAVPVSFGYHPYLTLPGVARGSWRVELPVRKLLELDDHGIPTGTVEPVDYAPFELGDSSWDDGFTGLLRPTAFKVSAAHREISVEFVAGYPFAQVYSPSSDEFICLEPMTAPTNALASGDELPVVPSEGSFAAAFRITVDRAPA